MNRMHIAHFTNTYLPFTNGVTRSVSTFRKALTASGHNVFVFAQEASGYKDKEPFIFRYPALELPVQDYPLAIPVSGFVDKLLPALKLDVIHAHHPALLGQVASRKAGDLDLPLVFTHHTRYQEYSHYAAALPQELVKDVIQRWLADYMEHCQHVVVPSESIKQMLVKTYGIQERVTVVPTGIDLEVYQKADGRSLRQQHGWEESTVLISVGRLALEKNWRTLLAAVALVMERHNDVRLVLLGDGDDRKELATYSRELGIAGRVEFLGTVPFDEIPHYLKAADLFCFASTTETQGLVTLEAMAAGLPVVAVDATGTADAVEDGVDGILTPNDSQALGEAIERVLNHEDLQRRLREAVTAKVRQFDTSKQAERLVAVYHQAIADKKTGRFVLVDRQKPMFEIMNWRKFFRVNPG